MYMYMQKKVGCLILSPIENYPSILFLPKYTAELNSRAHRPCSSHRGPLAQIETGPHHDWPAPRPYLSCSWTHSSMKLFLSSPSASANITREGEPGLLCEEYPAPLMSFPTLVVWQRAILARDDLMWGSDGWQFSLSAGAPHAEDGQKYRTLGLMVTLTADLNLYINGLSVMLLFRRAKGQRRFFDFCIFGTLRRWRRWKTK